MLPFIPAFFYDGKYVILTSWQKEETYTDKNTRLVKFLSPDHLLTVVLTVKTFEDHPVTEVIPELFANGEKDTKLLEKFRTLSFSVPLDRIDCEYTLRAVHGSRNAPSDFSARSFVITRHPEENKYIFTPGEGRSSAAWLPWFGVDLSPMQGWEIAIGWSGAWIAEFSSDGENAYMEAGLENCRFHMKKGEHFRLPSILLFRRENISVMDFQSVIHSFMLKYKSPKDSRKKLFPPCISMTCGGGNQSSCSMKKQMEYMRNHQYPFDTFWVDAGWYGPPHEPDDTNNCGNCWSKYVGFWQPNPSRHPGGLKDIASFARKNGMKFLLWFEPERATEGVPILAEHPEYFLAPPPEKEGEKRFLLDLGNFDAWTWLFQTVSSCVEKIGIDVYRQDFNIDPMPYWKMVDEPDRTGTTEIKHIMGLYAFWDALQKKYPDMLLENCASGGRRLDYEMVSRSHSYCQSDFQLQRKCPPGHPKPQYQLLLAQNAMNNITAYVPFHCGESNPVNFFDDYALLSVAGIGNVFTPLNWSKKGPYREVPMPGKELFDEFGGTENKNFPAEDSFTEEEEKWLKERFTLLKRLQNIFCGDFYFLNKEKTQEREDCWIAYQAWNEKIAAGAALFFRRQDDREEKKTFLLKGIDENSRYETEDMQGNKSILSGKELINFSVELKEPRSVHLFFYKKV